MGAGRFATLREFRPDARGRVGGRLESRLKEEAAMKLRAAAVTGLLALACLGCASITVSTDYDPDADFSGFRTFSWMSKPGNIPDDPRIDSDLLRSRIEDAVRDTMTAKGYDFVEKGSADLLLGYHVTVEDKVDVSTFDNYYGYRGGWYYYGAPYAYQDTYVRQYQVGTLILDVANGKTKRLIWRGTAKAELLASPTPEEREERIREAVEKMLDKFPPE
jgi:hypothetical protein